MTEKNEHPTQIPVLTLNPASMAKDQAVLETAAAELQAQPAPEAKDAVEAVREMDTSMRRRRSRPSRRLWSRLM